MDTILKHIILVISSLSIIFVTLLIPVHLENNNELRDTKLGYPACFLEQNLSGRYGNLAFFPIWEKVDWSGKSPVVSFSFPWMLFDLILTFIALEAFIYTLETIDFAIRKEK